MSLTEFLDKLHAGDIIDFKQTMHVIDEYYDYQPCMFSNGLNQDVIVNAAGINEGSCKIFAFARLHQLNQAQTLQLFGDYYRIDVLENPEASGHQNIRNFMKYGWDGITLSDKVLTRKSC